MFKQWCAGVYVYNNFQFQRKTGFFFAALFHPFPFINIIWAQKYKRECTNRNRSYTGASYRIFRHLDFLSYFVSLGFEEIHTHTWSHLFSFDTCNITKRRRIIKILFVLLVFCFLLFHSIIPAYEHYNSGCICLSMQKITILCFCSTYSRSKLKHKTTTLAPP